MGYIIWKPEINEHYLIDSFEYHLTGTKPLPAPMLFINWVMCHSPKINFALRAHVNP